MINNNRFVIVFAATLLMVGVTLPSLAGSPAKSKNTSPSVSQKSVKTVAAVYTCPDCHKMFTLAQAKKDGMKCSCCQTKLVVAKAQSAKKGAKG